jgi:hypothetical protein
MKMAGARDGPGPLLGTLAYAVVGAVEPIGGC